MYPLFIFVSLHLLSPAAADLAGDGSALLAFSSAVGRILPWNISSSPCRWKGVACTGNRVTSIRLPGRGLIGQIPAGTLGNLSDLRTLSLRRNALYGPLPSDLASCSQLESLYVNQNHLSGEIPTFISSISSLVRVNLADNNFSGEIPLSLNNLTRLNMLYLENNNFSGKIPNLDIPKLKWFNVSFNRLNGSVPEKLRGMPENSFLGMSLCGGPLESCPGETLPSPADSSSLSGGEIAGIAMGSVAVFLLILAVLFLFFRRKGKVNGANSMENPAGKLLDEEAGKTGKKAAVDAPSPETVVSKKQLVFVGSVPRVFDLEDLLRASADVLGKGTCGIAYKAALEEDLVVVVKRLRNVNMPEKDFAKKIEAISALEHPNLLPLRAYYYSRAEKFLVYDYMPTGSLASLLHGNRGGYDRTPLNWETRIKIAINAARGIEYIHSASPSSFHGNIKSSNILLTASYEVRVSDHGLANLLPSSTVRNLLAGHPDALRFTPMADVFSFGVLLLELVTGKTPARHEGAVNLRRWVESLIREELTGELFDVELVKYKSPVEEMAMLLQVGVDCTSENADHRPEMQAVVAKLEEIRHLATRKKDKLKEKERPAF